MKKRVVKTLLCMCMTAGLVSSSYVMPVMADSDVTLTLAMCGDGTTKASLDKLLEKYTEESRNHVYRRKLGRVLYETSDYGWRW